MERYKIFPKGLIEDEIGDWVRYTPLVAAAPDLLEALKEACGGLRDAYSPMTMHKIIQRAESAIAKAAGEDNGE